MKTRALALIVVALGFVGCNAWLAQFGVFANLRPQLVQQCCECLARESTGFPGAACAEAFVNADGGQVLADDDGGPSIPGTANQVDAGETVPCLCSDDLAACVEKIGTGGTILVTGACISQPGARLGAPPPPCAYDCQGVIDFDPLKAAP